MEIELKGGGVLSRRREGSGDNFIFLPGGPGLGAESLLPLIDGLGSPASFWTLDYCRSSRLADWQSSVVDLAGRLERMILVGHSFGGMLLLSIPELEKTFGSAVRGWAFLSSSPGLAWKRLWVERGQDAAFPEAVRESERLEKELAASPTEDKYRALFLSWLPFYFEPEALARGRRLLSGCSYFPSAYALEAAFMKDYDARWIPKAKTLVIAGEVDRVTPLECFSQDPRFCGPNVECRSIARAGHFPWVENLPAVAAALTGAFP